MQVVDARPAELAAAHALHRRQVAGAPGQRELLAIDAEAERLDLAGDGTAEIDDRAEHVEGQHAYVGDGRGGHAVTPA